LPSFAAGRGKVESLRAAPERLNACRAAQSNVSSWQIVLQNDFACWSAQELIQDHRPIRNVDFKNSHGQIHSFQIYIPQLRHGDFCNMG
jgi:hypothetical protein